MDNMEEKVCSVLRDSWLVTEDEHDGFVCEIYADYRDYMCDDEIGEILSSPDPESGFYEKLDCWYFDTKLCEKEALTEEVIAKLGSLYRLSEEEEEEAAELIDELVSFRYPEEHFLKQEVYVNIMLDTGDGNYDFVSNSVYPCWYGRMENRIDDKAGILWLAKSQGYNKTQLWNALKEGDMRNPKGFLQSMRVELANLPSHMSTVTFLVKMTFEQLLRLNKAIHWRDGQCSKCYDAAKYPYSGYIVLGKETMCGLYDPWSGGGSVLEIELERDIRIPIKYVWKALPDKAEGNGYSVGSVYGMCGSAWRDTIKKLHIPSKILDWCYR